MVGAGRFERPTPCAQGRCATRLRYAPTNQQLTVDYTTNFSQRQGHSSTSKPIPIPFGCERGYNGAHHGGSRRRKSYANHKWRTWAVDWNSYCSNYRIYSWPSTDTPHSSRFPECLLFSCMFLPFIRFLHDLAANDSYHHNKYYWFFCYRRSF